MLFDLQNIEFRCLFACNPLRIKHNDWFNENMLCPMIKKEQKTERNDWYKMRERKNKERTQKKILTDHSKHESNKL